MHSYKIKTIVVVMNVKSGVSFVVNIPQKCTLSLQLFVPSICAEFVRSAYVKRKQNFYLITDKSIIYYL